jgi:hypothetical protein
MRINEDFYDNIERSDIETNVSDTLDREILQEMMLKCIEDVRNEKRPEWDVTEFPDAIYKVTDWDDLDLLILDTMEIYGNDCNLNWIDVSEMTEMDELFSENNCGEFNGDISRWDVSRVKNMSSMFYKSKFNGKISGWDVSRVEDMSYMFVESEFNGNISRWDVRRVKDFKNMFKNSKFRRSLSLWLYKNKYFSYKTAGLW